MIRRAVARILLPQSVAPCSREKLLRSERLCRPRPEAIERELGPLVRFNINQDVVVLLLGSLALPIEVGRIVGGYLDARPARQDWVLFRTTSTQHQILHPI